ncbi:MAG TPA: phosphopantetheine-binding protein [Smithellaceae bacterium]|nr:phosphopantetheine-binding protein [Smithellaceae bacterium]
MTRDDIEKQVLEIFLREFEVDNPDMDANLREAYEFDSIDAIELLLEIEKFLGSELSQDEKKQAMDIRTLRQVCDYIEHLARVRNLIGQKG